jgi:hypothetical protein
MKKRLKVKRKIADIDVGDLDGTIDSLVAKLQNYENDCLVESYGGYDNSGLEIYRLEDENDVEYAKRMKAEEKEKKRLEEAKNAHRAKVEKEARKLGLIK